MAKIETLVQDIYARLDSAEPFKEEDVSTFAKSLAAKLVNRLSEIRGATTLRLSNWASGCERQLWYKINMPETVEPLPPHVRLKFLIGDITEEVLFFLSRAAGHTVTGEQDELSIGSVKGHRDGLIDGELTDAKSASPFGFKKFATHGLGEDDSFGYLGQLESYLQSSRTDPELTRKDRAHFLALNKVSGEIVLDTWEFPDRDLTPLVDKKVEMLKSPRIPPRGYEPEPFGKSGNMKLPTVCSYCPVKAACHPGLRAFAYASGPVFLTVVRDLPRVPEIDLGAAEADT